MSHEQRSAISFELHLFRVVKNRSVLTVVLATKAELRPKNFINVIMRVLSKIILKMLKICSQVDLNFRCWE